MIGAAARRLHLRARPLGRRIEAMMMMRVLAIVCAVPVQRGQRATCRRRAARPAPGLRRPRDSRWNRPRPVAGQLRQNLFALAHAPPHRHPAFAASRAAWSRRAGPPRPAFRPHRERRRITSMRHPQFRRRASPEEIARRGGDHREVRPERGDALADSSHAQARPAGRRRFRLHGRRASSSALRIAVLQRQVRLAASEVDAALETPGRINE